MAKYISDEQELNSAQSGNEDQSSSPKSFDALTADGSISVGHHDFITNSTMTQDGHDLVLTSPSGDIVIIENYFIAEPAPMIMSDTGQALSQKLVDSFTTGDARFASNESMNDESAIGIVTEFSGEGTVTRPDGTTVPLQSGMSIFQGDIVETEFDAAVNITFVDESSLSVGEDARMAIDEFVFDPATNDGSTNVSVLRGVFMYTSGLMGRDNPDSVEIDTPVGSIGIRGTIIGGKITPDGQDSQITVVEGAIVVTNGAGEQILSSQFETVKLGGFDAPIENIGQIDASQINQSYGSVRAVSGNLFSSIDSSAANNNGSNPNNGNGNASQDGNEAGNEQNTQNGGEAGSEPNAPDAPADAAPQSDGQQDGEPTDNANEAEAEGEPSEASEAGNDGPNSEGQGESSDADNNQASDAQNAQDASFDPLGNSGPNNLQGQNGQNLQNSRPNAGTKNIGNKGAGNNQANESNNDSSTSEQPVTFIDKAPIINVLQVYTVNENDTSEQNIAKLNIVDPNSGDVINLNRIIVGGNNNAVSPLRVEEIGGEYFLVKKAGFSFNFEDYTTDTIGATTTTPLQVQIFDANSNVSRTLNLPIRVENVDEAPDGLIVRDATDSADFVDISENAATLTDIATLIGVDPETGSSLIYSLSGPDAGAFTIVGDKLQFSVEPDFETQSAYNIDITVSDGTNSNSFNFTVNVTDEAEAPLDIVMNNGDVFDNIGGTDYDSYAVVGVQDAILGRIDIEDPDAGSNYNAGDFTITHPSDPALDAPLNDFLEIVKLTNSAGQDYFVLKLQDDTELRYNSSNNTFQFIKGGTPYDLEFDNNNVDGFFGSDTNGKFAFDVQVEVNDATAGASITQDFKISVEESMINVMTLNGRDGFRIINDARNTANGDPDALFGSSVTTGDFNNDGTLDFAAGAAGAYNAGLETSGGVYIIDGNPADPTDVGRNGLGPNDRRVLLDNMVNGSLDGHFEENQDATDNNSDHYGEQIANLGDINGDGIDDLIATIPGQSAARILFGGTATTLDITNLKTDGIQAISVSYAGDINGDGFNDIVIGTEGSDLNSYTDVGEINIIYGNANIDTLGSIDMSAPSGVTTDNFNSSSTTNGTKFGASIATTDFNGDGFSDIIIGEPGDAGSRGRVHFMAGNPAGPNPMFTLTGSYAGGQLGHTVVNAGDVNGDGLEDFLVSAIGENSFDGAAYMIFGNNSIPTGTNDINTYVGTAANGFKIQYDSTGGGGEGLGYSMAGGGDFNGDGVDDFVITGINGEMIDKAFVVFGGANLANHLQYISGTANVLYLEDIAITSGLGMVLNYSDNLDGDGTLGEDQFMSVAFAGDVNEDGFDDIIMGAEDYNDGQGASFVIYGRDVADKTLSWTGTGITNAAANESYVGDDDDNKIFDSGNDGLSARGAAGDDLIRISNLNFEKLDGGQDFDKVKFEFSADESSTPTADSIDLRGLGGRIENIEEFFINSGASGGVDTLHINLEDVFSLLQQSDNNELLFSTNAASNNAVRFYSNGSLVQLGGAGFANDADGDTNQDTEVIGSDTYYKYTLVGTDYSVLLDSQLMNAASGGDI